MNESFLPTGLMIAFSSAVGFLFDETPDNGVFEHAMDAIEQLIRPSSISVELFLPEGRGVRHLADRRMTVIQNLTDILPVVLKDHPSVLHLQSHPTAKLTRLSDFVTRRQLRELSLWHYACKFEGWVDQIAVMCPTAQGVVGFALNRDYVFSDEERLAYLLFQPHLCRLLNRDAVYAHLEGIHPLTLREREVLHWIARGKGDDEISAILGCAPRTIERHVQALLRKLHVENRTSAAMMLVTNTGLPPAEALRIGL